MANIKFLYDNFWDGGTLTHTSEHSNFPAENTQHRDFNKEWRSNYGAGSGWGNFLITAGSNDDIDFEETASSELTATLTPGSYTADELAAEIETQLESAGGSGYTVTYSDTTNKFTIVSDGVGGGGILNLLWSTGTNTATSVGDDIGFDTAADDTGSLTYTADDPRIHTHETLTMNTSGTLNFDAVVIRGHNFSATATVSVQFSDDNFSSVDETANFTVQDDVMVLEWDTAKSYQDIRILMVDVDNSDGYVKIGRIFAGDHFQPTRNLLNAISRSDNDPSVILESDDGQESSLQLSHFKDWGYRFQPYGSTQVGYFQAMIGAVGTSKAFFLIEDPDSPLTTTYYVRLTSIDWTAIRYDLDYWDLSLGIREQR